jgi:electron transfer flavoprotein alpha subunit
MSAGVLVLVALAEGDALTDAAKGLLGEGERLAATLGGRATAVEVEAGSPLLDEPAALADVLAETAAAAGARVVLLVHDDLGATLAPLVAARLAGPLFTEAMSYALDYAGLTLRRPSLGARLVEQRVWAGATSDGAAPLVLTLAPRVLSTVPPRGTAPFDLPRKRLAAGGQGPAAGLQVLERIPPDPQTMDVADAEVIFTAGKGCDPETFAAMCELARLVGASVGVTRPVYDLGWTGVERMIGQTGKTVVPRLYVAFGLSGSMHHVGGISESKRIVCLNVDPKAPIFPNADEGFVADVREVLPALVERVRAAGAAGARPEAVPNAVELRS